MSVIVNEIEVRSEGMRFSIGLDDGSTYSMVHLPKSISPAEAFELVSRVREALNSMLEAEQYRLDRKRLRDSAGSLFRHISTGSEGAAYSEIPKEEES